MKKQLDSLSIFFPLYNEEKNVKPLVEEALKVFPKVAKEYEIILVNDGSTDKTKEIAEDLAQKHQQIRVVNQANQGYGGALKTGFKYSTYEWVFFSDGDLQFDLSEIEKFIEHTENFDFIVGHRIKRAEGFKRLFITWLLKIWNLFFFNFPLHVKDIDCAFKLMKKGSLEKLLPLNLDGGLISTELLLRAHRAGFEFKQIPVNHKIRQHGESSGDSAGVIVKAIKETKQLLDIFEDRKNYIYIILFWTALGFLLTPVALGINYMQNDEYTHYRLVAQFLTGNFTLDPYLGATFYVQGFLATVYSYFLGIRFIPLLTLTLSITTAELVSLLLSRFFNTDWKYSILAGLFVFVSPLFLYSSWGFMSENYFMFFFVLSLGGYLSFFQSYSKRDFVVANLFSLLSYGVRQFGLFTPLAVSLTLLYKKKYRFAFLQLVVFVVYLFFHFNIFPQTPQMYDGRLLLSNLLYVDGTVTRVYIFGIYVSVFLAPFILIFLYKVLSKNPKKLFLLLFVPLLFWGVEKKFEPENVNFTVRTREGVILKESISTEFPYLGNIFTRKGFYEDNLPGDKYIFPGYFDLFNLMGIAGKLLFLTLLIYGIAEFKNLNKLGIFYSVVLVGVLLVSPRVFDRYLLPLVVSGLLVLGPYLKQTKISYAILTPFLIAWMFLGYQFTADSILVNKYIWNESIKISVEEGVPRNKISADHSWRQLYPNQTKDRIYHFTYKDFGRSQKSKNYSEIKITPIQFPLNFYKEPNIYLYYNVGAVED